MALGVDAEDGDVPVNLSFDPALVDEVSRKIGSLGVEQNADRLHRLERSMLRMERINLEILAMLKKLVLSASKPQAAEPKQ